MSKILNCRMAKLEDLDIIFKMEQKIFNQPWTKNSIYNELNKTKNKLNIIAEIDKKIIGYFFSNCFDSEVHILNFVIDTPFQHKGFGKIFLSKIINQYLKNANVFLEVKRTNFPAVNLYLSFGFQEINIRKDYYSDGEDAIEMVKKVSNYGMV